MCDRARRNGRWVVIHYASSLDFSSIVEKSCLWYPERGVLGVLLAELDVWNAGSKIGASCPFYGELEVSGKRLIVEKRDEKKKWYHRVG